MKTPTASWQQELAENPRLQLGLITVAVILAFSALLWVSEQRDMAAAELAREQGRQERLAAMAEDQVWQQRLAEVKTAQAALESRFWQARSEGQAQAEFQGWLMERAAHYEIERLNVSVVGMGPVPDAARLWQISLRLTGRLEGDALAGLLQDLAFEPRLVTVRALRVQGGRRQRFELETVAWFVAPEALASAL